MRLVNDIVFFRIYLCKQKSSLTFYKDFAKLKMPTEGELQTQNALCGDPRLPVGITLASKLVAFFISKIL